MLRAPTFQEDGVNMLVSLDDVGNSSDEFVQVNMKIPGNPCSFRTVSFAGGRQRLGDA